VREKSANILRGKVSRPRESYYSMELLEFSTMVTSSTLSAALATTGEVRRMIR
jgi:hypothetical protein